MAFDIETSFIRQADALRLYQDFPKLEKGPEHACPTCGGFKQYFWKGRNHPCNCSRQLQLHKHYLVSGIGVTYQRLDWSDYEGNPEVAEQMKKYLEGHVNFVGRGIGLLLSGNFGSGKCAALGTLANMADGSYKKVEDLVPGDKVLGGTVAGSESNGVKPTYKVTTTHGHELVLTDNHPVWVEEKGWVRTDKLSQGDQLQLASGWEPEIEEEEDSDEHYRLLGYLVADGGLTQRQTTWSKDNPNIISDLKRCAEAEGFKVVKVPGDNCDFRINGVPREWREKNLGSRTARSPERVVPPKVFTSSNDKIRQFLTSYLESDGHVVGRSAEFYSTSKPLLVGVQSLLRRLGVPSSLRRKNGRYNGQSHLSWRLSVLHEGLDEVRSWSFMDDTNKPDEPFRFPDDVPEGMCRCGCGHPTEVWDRNNAAKGMVKGEHKRFIRGHHAGEVNIKKAKSDSVCRVKTVEFVGEQETWAIQVDPTRHLYLGDILTHNTMLATLLLKDLVKLGYRCMATTFSETVEAFTAGWKSTDDQRYFREKFVNSDVLLLDDLGREFRSKNSLNETTFDNLLRSRVQGGRPTFITTNMSMDELEDGYGGAVISLLREVCLEYNFPEDVEDFRPKSQKRALEELSKGEVRPIV